MSTFDHLVKLFFLSFQTFSYQKILCWANFIIIKFHYKQVKYNKSYIQKINSFFVQSLNLYHFFLKKDTHTSSLNFTLPEALQANVPQTSSVRTVKIFLVTRFDTGFIIEFEVCTEKLRQKTESYHSTCTYHSLDQNLIL